MPCRVRKRRKCLIEWSGCHGRTRVTLESSLVSIFVCLFYWHELATLTSSSMEKLGTWFASSDACCGQLLTWQAKWDFWPGLSYSPTLLPSSPLNWNAWAAETLQRLTAQIFSPHPLLPSACVGRAQCSQDCRNMEEENKFTRHTQFKQKKRKTTLSNFLSWAVCKTSQANHIDLWEIKYLHQSSRIILQSHMILIFMAKPIDKSKY